MSTQEDRITDAVQVADNAIRAVAQCALESRETLDWAVLQAQRAGWTERANDLEGILEALRHWDKASDEVARALQGLPPYGEGK